MPILPEIVVGCLDNIAAFKHRDVSGNVANGASEWAVRFISRVLREDPGAIVAAVEMQTGTAAEQSRQVKERIEKATAEMLEKRPSIFYGNVWED